MKKTNINESPLKEYNSIPTFWPDRPRTINYEKLPTEEHFADGWRDIVEPVILTDTQRKGPLVIEANGTVTYEVIDLTDEEIKARIISTAEGSREEILQNRIRQTVEAEFQAITDDAEAIENQPAFPIWDRIEEGFDFPADYKVQDFDGLELKLFKIITPHFKQFDRRPNETPALWSKIEIGAGGLEIWTQPIGGDGKYPYINPVTSLPYRVIHNGFIWENNFTTGLNVWVPGVFGWTQIGPA